MAKRKKDKTGGMGKKARGIKDKVDADLSDREASVLLETEVDLESLRPRVGDGADFDKLIQAVDEATRNNENLAQLQQRITALGKGVIEVAKKVVSKLG